MTTNPSELLRAWKACEAGHTETLTPTTAHYCGRFQFLPPWTIDEGGQR